MSRQLTSGVLGRKKTHPLFPYLIEGYKMEGNSNGIRNIINGSDTNVTYANGKVGDAAVFNGSAFINLGQKNELDLLPNSEWSFSFWENTPSGNSGYYVAKAPTGTPSTHQFSIYRLTDIRAVVGGSQISTGFASFGQWNHVVLVNKPIDNLFYIYINKTNIYNRVIGSTIAPDTDLLIGARRNSAPNTGTGFLYTGSIDELYFFNKALTPDEINYLYDNPL